MNPARLSLLTRRLFIGGATAVGLDTIIASARAEEPAGEVTAVTGEAQAELGTKKRTLAVAEPVFVGDQISTGNKARAGLKLGKATTVRLGEQVRLKIDRFVVSAGGTITLGRGAALIDRAPDQTNEPLRIRSPYAQIVVRGTQFFAGPSNGVFGVFGVFVVRGSVSVQAAGTTVILEAGEGTDIARRGARPTIPKRWGDARVRAAIAQVE